MCGFRWCGRQLCLRNMPISGVNATPRPTAVYASDPALPRRPQDSLPSCLLGFERTRLSLASSFQLPLAPRIPLFGGRRTDPRSTTGTTRQTTAGALPSTMGRSAGSPLAVFASPPQSPPRSSSAYSLSASKRRWRLFRRADAKTPRSADRSNWRSSRRVSRPRTLDGNMTLSTPTTGWSPANWSGVGTSA